MRLDVPKPAPLVEGPGPGSELRQPGLVRCEAYRGRWSDVARALESSGMTVAEIEALAVGDPRLQQALKHDKVRKALKDIIRRDAPR